MAGTPGARTGSQTGHGGDGGDGGGAGSVGSGAGGAAGGHEGGGTDGGAGGRGGAGAGGGVLLVCDAEDGLVLTGRVESLGSDGERTAGGTVKLRWRGRRPDLDRIAAGRVHARSLDGGEGEGEGEGPAEGEGEGPAEGEGEGPVEPGDILDPQRGAAFVAGDVSVVGNRLVVGGRAWYPKTDFLTAVAPGDDIIAYNTHTYLGQDDAARRRIRDALVASRYNSIYVYTLNQGDYRAGQRAANVVTPYGDGGWSFDVDRLSAGRVAAWRRELERLIEAGLKPFVWLAADDSPEIARADLARWRTYVGHMVAAFEDLPVVWVLGLEVDEYWSAAQVAERRAVVQERTRHPVGVHLTVRLTRDPGGPYTRDFDLVLGQLASPQGNAAYEQDVRRYALADRPWLASEFNVSGTGDGPEAEATVRGRSGAIGRFIARLGDPPLVAGLGNGIRLVDDEAPDPEPREVPADFAGVTWLHTNVSGWPVTADLRSVRVDGGQICLDYDRAGDWPGVDHVGAFVNANPWIFVWHDNRWYAATWEWMRHGQTCKNRAAVAGDHIKRDPLRDFAPRSGEWYGFMVSGLARDNVRNAEERSQVRMVQWP